MAAATAEPSGGDFRVELVPRLGPAVADYPPGSTFGPRLAQTYEFVWVLGGSATWHCDDLEVTLAPGRLLLVRPGMRDSFDWDSQRPTRHAYVHFRLYGRPADRCAIPAAPAVRELSGRSDPMGALCHYLLWLGSTRPPSWRHHAQETLRLLVLTFVAAPAISGGRGDGGVLPPAVIAAMAAVRGRWSDGIARPVTLPDLAGAAGVSVSTLCRVFHRRFGIGPVAALERLRLARAEPLLWMSNLSLEAIARQCGFADAYHFSRRFSAVYGLAPSAFRTLRPENAPPSPVTAKGLSVLESLVPPP